MTNIEDMEILMAGVRKARDGVPILTMHAFGLVFLANKVQHYLRVQTGYSHEDEDETYASILIDLHNPSEWLRRLEVIVHFGLTGERKEP